MRELYVYWKAPRQRSAEVQAVIGTALAELMRQQPDLHARLLHRSGEAGETITWMETYAAGDGITPALQALIEASLSPLLARLDAGPRHAEVFEAPA